MKALTVWQPWASLIIAGYKQYEFRKWSFAGRFPDLVGQRIVIHAGARMPKRSEVMDIRKRVIDGVSQLDESCMPRLERMCAELGEWENHKPKKPRRVFYHNMRMTGGSTDPNEVRLQEWAERVEEMRPNIILSAGLGTAVLGDPQKAAELFDAPTNDSYRADHSIWAWPLHDVVIWDEPAPMKGAQGFWSWKQ